MLALHHCCSVTRMTFLHPVAFRNFGGPTSHEKGGKKKRKKKERRKFESEFLKKDRVAKRSGRFEKVASVIEQRLR